MQHRDEIIIQKVLSEINLGLKMLGDASLESLLSYEMLKRAVSMTIINIWKFIKTSHRNFALLIPIYPLKGYRRYERSYCV